MKRIFFDQDGVLAGFEEHFLDLYGKPFKETKYEERWKKIYDNKTFFADLPLLAHGFRLFRKLWDAGMNPMVLTASRPNRYDYMAPQKMAWARHWLPAGVMLIMSPGGEEKAYYLQNPGDVLIDDKGENCLAWRAAGGNAFLWPDEAAEAEACLFPEPGYHVKEIPKGTLGEVSKIQEEVLELQDAVDQGIKVMQLVELSDLVGAVKLFLEKHHQGVTIWDLNLMSNVTQRAFRNGRR